MGWMGCCGGKVEASDDNGDPNLIIDVEKVLEDAAWRAFRVSFGKWSRRFLKRKNYTIEVPIHYFTFEEVSRAQISLRDCPQGIDVNTSAESSKKSTVDRKALPHQDQTSPGHIGLETEFNNDTDEVQTYTFQFEKTRTAAVEVSYQKGYSIGGKANFSIGLPAVLGDGSVGLEVEKQLQVTRATGERFEESLKTSATSNIVVSKRSRYTASVVMEERNLLADFKLVMRMSMPAKCAPIYIRNKTGEAIFVRTVSNLPRLFKDFKQVSKVTENGRPRVDAVDFTIEGVMQGVKLSSHRINLYCHPKTKPGGQKPPDKVLVGVVQPDGKNAAKDAHL